MEGLSMVRCPQCRGRSNPYVRGPLVLDCALCHDRGEVLRGVAVQARKRQTLYEVCTICGQVRLCVCMEVEGSLERVCAECVEKAARAGQCICEEPPF